MLVTALATATMEESMTADEALRKYPRLVSHLICESLGYFTPHAAANAVAAAKNGRPYYCEWYVHMASVGNKSVTEVTGKTLRAAIRNRHYHKGFMADYRLARALVDQVRAGGPGPIFASWM